MLEQRLGQAFLPSGFNEDPPSARLVKLFGRVDAFTRFNDRVLSLGLHVCMLIIK